MNPIDELEAKLPALIDKWVKVQSVGYPIIGYLRSFLRTGEAITINLDVISVTFYKADFPDVREVKEFSYVPTRE